MMVDDVTLWETVPQKLKQAIFCRKISHRWWNFHASGLVYQKVRLVEWPGIFGNEYCWKTQVAFKIAYKQQNLVCLQWTAEFENVFNSADYSWFYSSNGPKGILQQNPWEEQPNFTVVSWILTICKSPGCSSVVVPFKQQSSTFLGRCPLLIKRWFQNSGSGNWTWALSRICPGGFPSSWDPQQTFRW